MCPVLPDQDPQAAYGELPREHELLSVVGEIGEVAGGREDAALALGRKIFSRMVEIVSARCAPVGSHEGNATFWGLCAVGTRQSSKASMLG